MIVIYTLTGKTIFINSKAVAKICVSQIDAKYHICITHIRKGVLWNGYGFSNEFEAGRVADALEGGRILTIEEVREYD